MRSVSNISKLFVSSLALVTAVSLSGCMTGDKIPDVKVYKEIPFIDAPEGVFVTTATHQEGIIGPKDWEALAPFLLCVDEKGFAAIKEGWLRACRFAPEGDACKSQISSVADLVKKLDDISRAAYPFIKAAP